MATKRFSPRNVGSARMGGAVIAAMAVALAIGLVIVLKEALHPPAARDASTAAGAVSGAQTVSQVLDDAHRSMVSGEYAAAAATLRRCIQANPSDQELRTALAESLVAQEQFGEAYEQYEKALAIGPRSAKLNFLAGTVATKAGRLDRAREHYEMAQSADMTNWQIPLYLAMVQLRSDPADAVGAAANLVRVVKLKPDCAEAWGTLGEIYFKDDKLSIALQNIERARELEPGLLKWRLDEARIHNRLNEPQQAATLLLAITDKTQLHGPEVLKILGESYGMLGKPAEAAKLFADAAGTPDGALDPELNYQTALWFDRAKDGAGALRYGKVAAMLGHADAKDLVAQLSR